GQIHVVRALQCYGHEAYEAGENVILTRETVKWVRELVGTVEVTEFAEPEKLREELGWWVFQAVVGTSRLPLTSLESPLPAFSLGQMAFVPRTEQSRTAPTSDWRELIELQPKSRCELVKLLEFIIRAVPPAELTEVAPRLGQHWALSSRRFVALL